MNAELDGTIENSKRVFQMISAETDASMDAQVAESLYSCELGLAGALLTLQNIKQVGHKAGQVLVHVFF